MDGQLRFGGGYSNWVNTTDADRLAILDLVKGYSGSVAAINKKSAGTDTCVWYPPPKMGQGCKCASQACLSAALLSTMPDAAVRVSETSLLKLTCLTLGLPLVSDSALCAQEPGCEPGAGRLALDLPGGRAHRAELVQCC